MINPGRSYWESVLYDQQYDLIIVGAGISGQSAALFFKEQHPDAKVLIIDRGTFPIGASTRNAGFACFGTIGEHLADLDIEQEAVVKNRIRRRYEGLLLLREVIGDELIDYQHCGGWELFTEEAEFVKARDQIARINTWMEELISEKEVYESRTYRGIPAIFNREEGMLHPGKLIRELHHRNIQSGVEFRWDCPIDSVDTEEGAVNSASGIRFYAHRLILAGNAFTSKLIPDQEITPGRGYVMVTSELKAVEWKGTFHYNKGYVYFRNLGENRILIGGGRNVDMETETTPDFGINQAIREYLIGFCQEVLDLPEGWTIEQEWSGIMGFTKTKSPVVKKLTDKTIILAGLSGMGVALGMQLGREASELV